MKLKVYGSIFIVIAGVVLYYFITNVGWSRIETKLRSEGTIQSDINEVQAAGWNLRTVSWIDTHGRHCTTLFTNEKGGMIDCDFK